jgi:anti-anti-sigma regulatory factor
LIYSSNFKYYIHDGAVACRLQLLGQVSESEVAELTSCWQTAQTTLGSRQLVLDLREVNSIDDAGKKWLAGMIQDGAACLPESFLVDAIAGSLDSRLQKTACAKPGWFLRAMSLFRGGALTLTKPAEPRPEGAVDSIQAQ